MKKAKALFAAGIIVIVAGASALCLYLNDNGKLSFCNENAVTEENAVAPDAEYDYVLEDDEPEKNVAEENVTNQTTTEVSADDKEETPEDAEKVDTVAINEFLSTFSRLYFCNNDKHSEKNPDKYEMLKFAYLYAEVFENGAGIRTEIFDDDIGIYNGIGEEDVKRITEKFFGMSLKSESVHTENDYQFFMYSDGYFYTPAADGVGYVNLSVADFAVKNGDTITVSFTVYSDGVSCDMTSEQAKKKGTVYASGKAEIQVKDDNYRLISYSVKEK